MLRRAKLFKSPVSSAQFLEQQFKLFYSDTHLLMSDRFQSDYERMARIITTTSLGNSGKGIPTVKRELDEMITKLAEQYDWDRDEVGEGQGRCPGKSAQVPSSGWQEPCAGVRRSAASSRTATNTQCKLKMNYLASSQGAHQLGCMRLGHGDLCFMLRGHADVQAD
jgi:hypothetical protein